PRREGDLRQHLRRHHEVRHDRGRRDRGRQRGRAQGAARRAARRHQRRARQEDARREQAQHRRSGRHGRRCEESRRGCRRCAMSVLVGYNTKLVVQGMSGSAGAFHAKQMVDYGTNVVAGVTPGKGGSKVAGLEQVPMYDTVEEAVRLRGANTTVIYVPPPFAADSILEAAAAGIRMVIAITEGIPARDMVRVKYVLDRDYKDVVLVGP